MKHTVPVTKLVEQIGPQIEDMVSAIEACVHCGFCLPTCPTYQVLSEEMDSPRGRIFLMKSVLEGELNYQEVMPYIDQCLGCMACVTSCPSGVQYGELVLPFRVYAQSQIEHTVTDRLKRKLINETLPYPNRFRSAASLGLMSKPLLTVMPKRMQDVLALLPERLPETETLPELVHAQGNRRARVALLTGCVQQVFAQQINWATIRVLVRNGVEVVIPSKQVCCGALSIHTSNTDQARQFARVNFSVFPDDVDAILTNAAGCGSGMKEYPLLFKGMEDEPRAQEFTNKVQDVSEFLDNLGLRETPVMSDSIKVAYHDACHLAHAQGITSAPRNLIASISNVSLLEVPQGEICCGSAGTYNLEHPELANELGKRKVDNILEIGPDVVVTGNIGCIVQIQSHLGTNGNSMPVYHTFELLDKAYLNES
ncbi:MAG: heterodisulfide reductase-related iron-sulfur binding cluster [Anaerolineales bacterium]